MKGFFVFLPLTLCLGSVLAASGKQTHSGPPHKGRQAAPTESISHMPHPEESEKDSEPSEETDPMDEDEDDDSDSGAESLSGPMKSSAESPLARSLSLSLRQGMEIGNGTGTVGNWLNLDSLVVGWEREWGPGAISVDAEASFTASVKNSDWKDFENDVGAGYAWKGFSADLELGWSVGPQLYLEKTHAILNDTLASTHLTWFAGLNQDFPAWKNWRDLAGAHASGWGSGYRFGEVSNRISRDAPDSLVFYLEGSAYYQGFRSESALCVDSQGADDCDSTALPRWNAGWQLQIGFGKRWELNAIGGGIRYGKNRDAGVQEPGPGGSPLVNRQTQQALFMQGELGITEEISILFQSEEGYEADAARDNRWIGSGRAGIIVHL